MRQAVIRGCADDLGLLDWLIKQVWVLQGSYTEGDGKTSAALCAFDMLKSGTHVTHNPASNGKTATGIAPVHGMLAANVNVTLGCDGGPSSNSYDMIPDMRMVSYLANLREKEPTVVPAEDVVEMATINGAMAMGIEDLGWVYRSG